MQIDFDLSLLDNNCQQLIHNTIDKAVHHDVDVIIANTNSVTYDELQCNGLFIEHPVTCLIVAADKPLSQWIPTFIHESCHMDQWIEQSDIWKNCAVGNLDKMDILQLWIDNKCELNDTQLSDYISCVRDIELDCEQRSVDKMIQYGIDVINIDEYIQRANAYVLFYNHIATSRSWYQIGNEPYNDSNIWPHMPTHWLKDYDPNYCQELMDLFTK